MAHKIAVYGASGTTGQFVLAELKKRGHDPLPFGRAQATADDPTALDRALEGAEAVINTAGPFAITAGPLIAAAERAGIPYVDVAAEIEANADTFARGASIPVVPAMAFFGGLGDLLVTAAMADWDHADEAHIAYGLSGWQPTAGTLTAGQVSHKRRNGQRIRFQNGELTYHNDTAQVLDWDFPTGTRQVISEFSMADVVTVPNHLRITSVTNYMSTEAATGLQAAQPRQEPETFEIDVRVRRAGEERRLTASGKDIYATTAPLAVEATERLLTGRFNVTGVASAGAMFDAQDFLTTLNT
ncbi:Saccharopine dehydrogenase NADP binding domain-containing protein [Lentzea albidocapillata subsp. violacea]|uniref:Saccharopine dehydrogenase NADP binding domain-containing protein n=1 Tax=Lentzea albidocapillata subsp. violacea TaxID=128104 RepID=A0A1G9WQV6_9PSEU|nr:saccharopine dehydrogenase NADP-binding domain-containing protein [Lentzea albidocapillata]SDM86984.1 Saccharopine dehydrogenase NADP binding domain-containing protein [Lentzea albidocapillata subsp. violacea]